MSLPPCISRVAFSGILIIGCALGVAQEFEEQGGEYQIVGSLPGDQVNSAVSVSPSGGLVVWEDNFTDGDGSGISAKRLDSAFVGIFSAFRVNEGGQGNQRKPDVAMLSDGGAAVVWQSDLGADSDIYLRCFSPYYTNYGGDILVNTFTQGLQEDPAVAALNDGRFVVVWASFNQYATNSMKDIYFRVFDSTGSPLSSVRMANQKTTLNQRTPEVCGLSDGSFLICWISETVKESQALIETYDVDVVARRFNSSGDALAGEFKVNATINPCANPVVSCSTEGGFAFAWSEKDLSNNSNSWDVVSRVYSVPGGVGSTPSKLNAQVYGDQFAPKLAAVGGSYLAAWTSLRQDGSHEGVFGRFFAGNGQLVGDELLVNSTVVGKQILPAIASDGGVRLIALWSGFNGITAGFDLYGQRYASVTEPLLAPEAPHAWPLSFNEISVTWPVLAGFDVTAYHLYVDGSASPTVSLANNQWLLTNAAPHSVHTFRLAYTLADGRTSPQSAITTATTYGQFGTITYGQLIPFDWMVEHWGMDFSAWPSSSVDSDGDGASNENEFLAGTDPNDPNSVLRTALEQTSQGLFLNWNTRAGSVYQVQRSPDFSNWTDLGNPRFASGAVDSVHVGFGEPGMFRVILLRK